MFGDSMDLAENKLLLLYIYEKIQLPLSNTQITQIVLENNFMNYFTLHQYISELISSKFIEYKPGENKSRLNISDRGSKVLAMFIQRIPKIKLETVDAYLKLHMDKIKKDITVSADYTIEKDNNYIVNLKVNENNIPLIDLKINVATNKQARDLCNKWKGNSSELYTKILNILVD